jgi:hypothetical protein
MSERKAQDIRQLEIAAIRPESVSLNDLAQRLICDLRLLIEGRWYDLPEADTLEGEASRPRFTIPIIMTLLIAAVISGILILRGRAQVCNQVMEAIDRVDSAFRGYARRRAAGQMDPATLNLAHRAYTDAVQRLAAYLHSASPYAGAARSILHGARTEDRTWIDSLLTLG